MFATALKCVKCTARYPTNERIVICSRCQGLLEMEYDYDDTARTFASEDGLFVEISAAPSVAGAMKLTHKGVIDKTDAVICELTATGLKSHEECSKVVRKPLEVQPNLDSLLQVLKP